MMMMAGLLLLHKHHMIGVFMMIRNDSVPVMNGNDAYTCSRYRSYDADIATTGTSFADIG